MGKLRFTLTYLLFWFIIVFSCLLAENFALFSSDHMGGMSIDSLIMLSMFVIFLLIVYYIRERNRNKITIDKVLLPIIVIFGLVSIATIWWQGDRSFLAQSNDVVTVSFSVQEKVLYTLQIVAWCAVLYGILFVFNRYSISRKWLKWLTFAYVIGVFACTLTDIVMEFKDITAIFTNAYTGSGLSFIIYNSNVWANIILVAVLTAVYISAIAIIAYTLYEIFSKFVDRKRYAARLLFVYFSVLLFLFGFFTMMINLNVPIFVNLWSFMNTHIFKKDYSTLTSRTGIWASVFHLLCERPIDLVFGLGYKTGNAIFTRYFALQSAGFEARSAHNGIVEITLRHGLFGLLLYVSLLSTFIVGIVKLLKNKRYRVAYIYGICFLGILAHSITESTMFFVPNIEATYLTMIFFLPVVNASKEKYFIELNKDLQKQNTPLVKPHRGDVLYFVGTFLLSIIVAFATSFSVHPIYSHPRLLTIYIVVASVAAIALIGVFITLILMSKKRGNNRLLFLGKEFIIPFVSSIIVGVITSLLLQLKFSFDTFSILLFTIFVIFFYMIVFSILYKRENNHLYAFFDVGFTKVLQTISREGTNE